MSRTYFLPVTVDLDGNPASIIPANLLFRQSDSPTLARTISRILFPLDYEYELELYNQADQVIGSLGSIDPVELWERSGQAGDRNAPDDFLATVSVTGPTGDTSGIAEVTILDPNLRPRFAPFLLGSDPETAPYASRYGIPLITGDQLLFSWATPPAGGTSAFVTVNLTPCDACELQTAAALWNQALKACCEAPVSCLAPGSAVAIDNFGAVTPLTVGPGGGPGTDIAVAVPPASGVWSLNVDMGTTFDPADYTAEVLVNGAAIPPGPPFSATITAVPPGPPGVQTTWVLTLTLTGPPPPLQVVELFVIENANPACVFTQGFLRIT